MPTVTDTVATFFEDIGFQSQGKDHGAACRHDFRTQVDDMTLLRAARPEYNMAIPYTDDRFVKDYLNPGWETAWLVHFPHGLTPQPRSRTIDHSTGRRHTTLQAGEGG
ncbi:MAG: hypothetical protein WD060_11655 [Pirellulales bacterium]